MMQVFGRPIALAALAVSLGAVAGPMAWRLTGAAGDITAVQPASLRPSAALAAARPDIAAVLAASPFGAVLPPDAPEVPTGESDLGFTLLGVMLAMPAENSRAMVADAAGKTQSHGVGADLASGVSVSAINADHIVLSVNGSLQRLSFPNALPETAAQPVPDTPSDDAGLAALNRLAPADASYFIADPVEATDAESVIARYRAAIRQNPLSVMLRLGIEATDRGYRVTDTTSQGVLNAGFRPGDIIRSVNGKPIGKVQNDVALFDEIAAAGLAQVELMRDGEEIKLSFPLR